MGRPSASVQSTLSPLILTRDNCTEMVNLEFSLLKRVLFKIRGVLKHSSYFLSRLWEMSTEDVRFRYIDSIPK